MNFKGHLPLFYLLHDICRNFVKELVILFHRISAAPWGHVVSIIKRAQTEDSSSFFPLPSLLVTGPFVAALDGKRIWYLQHTASSPWRQTYLVPSTHSQEPKATNARAELKGTGHTAKFQQAFYLQTFTFIPLSYNFILQLYLITLPYNFTLHLITNLTKPYLTLLLYAYHLSEHWTLFLNSYIFVVYSIWCKTLFVVCCI